MSSNKFFSKVQDVAIKTRLISRRTDLEDLIDDAWLYEGSADINYYDNSAGRAYENPKRETGRSAPSEKRTFGYQIPVHEAPEAEAFERQVKRSSRSLSFRTHRAPRRNNVVIDIVK